MADSDELRGRLRRRYAALATPGVDAGGSVCCEVGVGGAEAWGAARYDDDHRAGVAESVVGASLGCGNPVAMAELHPGEVVLDLGSGAGLDVILSARRVAPDGHAYGLDMTDEMLATARVNAAKEGVDNVTFLAGYLEAIPLPAESVDVILSNCVVNLSPDKPAAFAEMHRVLRPGGRLAISDVLAEQELPDSVRADPDAWDACLAGALTRRNYRDTLAAAGFDHVTLTDSHPITQELTSVVVHAARSR